jgi:hypothetical protein
MITKKAPSTPLFIDKNTKSKASSKTPSRPPIVEAFPHPNRPNQSKSDSQNLGTESVSSTPSRKKGPITRIIVKYDVGFNNSIYLRGTGADLSWERGIMLKNVKSDEWIWETNIPFTHCEFKVLINDRQYEMGENHRLQCGTSFEYSPNFHTL